MTTFSIIVDIAAPPERVWAVMADVERWPEWTPTVRGIRRWDRGPLAVGSRALVRQPRLPPALWRVSELREGRSFTWVSGGPGVCVVAEHSVEPLANGARARLSVRFTGWLGPLLARLTHRLNERYLALEAEGLRKRSTAAAESGPSAGSGAA
jgi:carbon monoxide dehydrogenase subunit G